MKLKSYELEVLNFLAKEKRNVSVTEVAENLHLKEETVNSVAESLKAKHLVKIQSRTYEVAKLTREGEQYAKGKLPERKVLSLIKGETKLRKLRNVKELTKKELKIALGWLKRKDLIEITQNTLKKKTKAEEEFQEEKVIDQIYKEGAVKISDLEEVENPNEIISRLIRRKIVQTKKKEIKKLQLTSKGKKVLKGEIGVDKTVTNLTSRMLASGEWRTAQLSKYDVSLSSYDIFPGKKHPYRQIIDELKEILIGLGFQEAKGPYVELNFWNCDALFMPSDHPARGVHDMFKLKKPSVGEIPNKEIWQQVKATHEDGGETKSKGWGFWDADLAKKLILRSHTTSVSVRELAKLTEEDLPSKIFTIDRNFRPDVIDQEHFIEFFQCEGIVVGKDLNFRNLLWFLKKIAMELGFKEEEVKFKPGYFPFTEPSVEGFVKIPGLGWVETLPGGIFRPEVTKPLGIDVPVLAWGIGIDRLAMKKLGINDIREAVFTTDLSTIREKENIML